MNNEADPERKRYSRRASLLRAGGLGAAGVLGGAALRPGSAEAAAASELYVVLDAAGGGDYTDVEAAVAALQPGQTLFVKQGTYTVKNAPLRPAYNTRILGEGYGSHIVAADGFNHHMFMVGGDNVVFENLRVDGNGANQALASGNCIYYDANFGRVSGCWVHDSPGYNVVLFPGSRGIVIEGNHVYSSREIGIELQGASYCTVVGNVVWNIAEHGILLWNSTGTCELNTVSGNTVRDCQQRGIQVFDGAVENTIAGNAVEGSTMQGIYVTGAGSTTIADNVSRGNGRSGIHVDSTPNCNIAGNLASQNSWGGIYVTGSEGCSVVGNNAYKNSWAGIEIGTYDTTTVEGGVCTSNVCANNGQNTGQSRRHGIILRGSYRNMVVSGNRCYDSQSSPTQLNGIAVTDGYPRNLLLSSNIVDGNAQSGISVDSGAASSTYSTPYKALSVKVGASETAIPHGLSYKPLSVAVTMTSAGTIWRSRASDATNIYLRADAANRTADVMVG